MPEPIQTADESVALARAFRIQGRLPLSLDEIVVPVVLVRDLSDPSQVAPASFGEEPGPELATGGFLVRGDSVGARVGGLVIEAGTRPLLVERVCIPYIETGDAVGVFAGEVPLNPGAIVIGGGVWGYRRTGGPSASITGQRVTANGVVSGAFTCLAVIPMVASISGAGNSSGGWFELNVAMQAGKADAVSKITLVPLNTLSVPPGDQQFITAQAPGVNSQYLYSVQWRE